MYDFVNGENIDFKGGTFTNFDDGGDPTIQYINTISSTNPASVRGIHQFQFITSDGQTPGTTNELQLVVISGVSGCLWTKKFVY